MLIKHRHSSTNWHAWLVRNRYFGSGASNVMPIEPRSKLLQVINMKTAKALGLTVPQSLLLRADEVIQ